VRILNVYVPGGTGAGAFTVRGTVIDGSKRWPFVAVIGVRANPACSSATRTSASPL